MLPDMRDPGCRVSGAGCRVSGKAAVTSSAVCTKGYLDSFKYTKMEGLVLWEGLVHTGGSGAEEGLVRRGGSGA
ncbi:hypothetical protein C0Q70_14490 [Pomacea canaliculata]|uniref:Uncharacterized protein n=1 Tax=Pomacea canaliculata TaxID=400727 RepID=A0A2T7P071_POMCA|nr:hypothetical protein C0Q70_14490 [Pomacea canaliculata]